MAWCATRSLFIIIPVYNRYSLTRACLSSLRAQTTRDFTVIVIDDGSTDETAETIINEYPEVVLLHGNGDLWWAGATNLGIQQALKNNADYILCLNNDTELAPDYIEKMGLGCAKQPDALLYSATYDINSKELFSIGDEIDWAKGATYSIAKKYKINNASGLRELTSAVGRGLLIPAIVFQRIGLFDSLNFPQAIADRDFTLRAYRAGFKIFCNCDSILFAHLDKATSSSYIENFSLKNYYKYLTDIKGGGNLICRWKFAMRNAPRKYKYRYAFISISRCIFGYLRRWVGVPEFRF